MLINFHTHIYKESDYQLFNNFLTQKIIEKKIKQSLGIHPWYIQNTWKTDLAYLKNDEFLSDLIAIGEVGLDKLIDIDFALQKEVFYEQILWAEEIQKPLIIHCVKAFQEILLMKKQTKSTVNWVFHGFSKKIELANQLIKEGCYLSFGHALLTNLTVQKTFREVPITKIFLETDDKDLDIQEIYVKASQLKNVSLQFLEEQIEQNFKQIVK